MNLINVSQLRAENILNIQGKVDIFSKKEIKIKKKGKKEQEFTKKLGKPLLSVKRSFSYVQLLHTQKD